MSGGLELPGGPGSRAAREEEARLPITRATPGVHQGVEAEAASEAPSRRGPAPKGAEAEAAWEAAASRLAPSGVSGALAPPQVSFAGDRAKRQKVETSGNLLLSETSGGQHGFSQCTLTARTSREAALTASPTCRPCPGARPIVDRSPSDEWSDE